MKERIRRLLGWSGVLLSTGIATLWMYWGILENFHEGWYHPSLIDNLAMMGVQYLSFPFAFLLLTLIGIRWGRVGGVLFLLLSFFFALLFGGFSFQVVGLLLVIPGIVFAFLYWFGRPLPRKIAFWVALVPPLATLLLFGIPDYIRVVNRFNDGDFGARTLQNAQTTLIWAPQGPGWPEKGTDWDQATEICRYLAEDGLTLESSPVDIWRLPTIEEAVSSLTRRNENAGGVWDPVTKKTTYQIPPDKETPLWNPHSMIIYWWTAESESATQAYVIAYNGGVWPRRKYARMGYLGFRAVKDFPAGP